MFFENTFLRLKWNRQALTEGHNLIHDTVRTTNADILSNVDQTISGLINCWSAEYLLSHSFVLIPEIALSVICFAVIIYIDLFPCACFTSALSALSLFEHELWRQNWVIKKLDGTACATWVATFHVFGNTLWNLTEYHIK